MLDSIIYPSHYRIFECRAGRWFIKNAEPFCNFSHPKCQSATSLEGITEQAVVIELFRINGGKTGYYLANLKDKKYYYCGNALEDVRTTLLSLGIGRADPLEK